MSQKTTTPSISVIKRVSIGHLPLFIQLAHKALEKGQADGIPTNDGGKVFNIPKDILGLSVNSPDILTQVESIEFTYKKEA